MTELARGAWRVAGGGAVMVACTCRRLYGTLSGSLDNFRSDDTHQRFGEYASNEAQRSEAFGMTCMYTTVVWYFHLLTPPHPSLRMILLTDAL
jgi:hypothetical protein